MSKRKIIDYFSKNTNQDDCEPTSSKNSTKTPSTLNKVSTQYLKLIYILKFKKLG